MWPIACGHTTHLVRTDDESLAVFVLVPPGRSHLPGLVAHEFSIFHSGPILRRLSVGAHPFPRAVLCWDAQLLNCQVSEQAVLGLSVASRAMPHLESGRARIEAWLRQFSAASVLAAMRRRMEALFQPCTVVHEGGGEA